MVACVASTKGKGKGGGGREKWKRGTGEERRGRSAYNKSPHNSLFLCSKSGRKMLVETCHVKLKATVWQLDSQVHVLN